MDFTGASTVSSKKEMFGASFKHVNYIECGIKGSHDEEAICKTAGVKNFPDLGISRWQPEGRPPTTGALERKNHV